MKSNYPIITIPPSKGREQQICLSIVLWILIYKNIQTSISYQFVIRILMKMHLNASLTVIFVNFILIAFAFASESPLSMWEINELMRKIFRNVQISSWVCVFFTQNLTYFSYQSVLCAHFNFFFSSVLMLKDSRWSIFLFKMIWSPNIPRIITNNGLNSHQMDTHLISSFPMTIHPHRIRLISIFCRQ